MLSSTGPEKNVSNVLLISEDEGRIENFDMNFCKAKT